MDQSPLDRCPPEIRNRIYELVLVQKKRVRLDRPSSASRNWNESADGLFDDSVRVITREGTKSPAVTLPLVCKQIYQESIGIVYGLNTFYFPNRTGGLHSGMVFEDFAEQTGEQNSRSLRRIVFRLRGNENSAPEDLILSLFRLSQSKNMVDCIGSVRLTLSIEGRRLGTFDLGLRDTSLVNEQNMPCKRTVIAMITDEELANGGGIFELEEELEDLEGILAKIWGAFG